MCIQLSVCRSRLQDGRLAEPRASLGWGHMEESTGYPEGTQRSPPPRAVHHGPELWCPSWGDLRDIAAQLTKEPTLPQGPQRSGASPGSQFAWQEGAWWGRGGEGTGYSPGSYTFSPQGPRLSPRAWGQRQSGDYGQADAVSLAQPLAGGAAAAAAFRYCPLREAWWFHSLFPLGLSPALSNLLPSLTLSASGLPLMALGTGSWEYQPC